MMIAWIRAQNWSAVDFVSSLAPWLAPLPTAWLVYDRTQHHLNWPQWVAAIAGITLELLGIGILATALEQYGYNRGKRKSDPPAPMGINYLLIAAYFIAAELLTVALDVAPGWFAPLAVAVFPVLSLVSMAVLALRANHKRRLTDIDQGKAEARAKREQRKAERTKPTTKPEQITPFACLVCGAQFATQSALNGHGNAHRTDNGRKPQEVERERQTEPG